MTESHGRGPGPHHAAMARTVRRHEARHESTIGGRPLSARELAQIHGSRSTRDNENEEKRE